MLDSNVWYCSPYTCVDISNPNNKETDQADLGSYTNDGTYDPQTGQCQGQIYIFNGTAGECRPKGTQTLFHNCCECETDPQCRPSEQTTSCAVSRGSTHYIGEYCKEKWKFIGCVQKAKVYCMFQSKLARIIQEQGRLQLIAFSPDGQWGTPKSPNCRGFTPEEFQALDFSKIDLSEYLNDMVQQSQQQIQQLQQNLSNTITQGIENIQPH
jgi:conjugal transfer mating pair stabilization protein TraN